MSLRPNRAAANAGTPYGSAYGGYSAPSPAGQSPAGGYGGNSYYSQPPGAGSSPYGSGYGNTGAGTTSNNGYGGYSGGQSAYGGYSGGSGGSTPMYSSSSNTTFKDKPKKRGTDNGLNNIPALVCGALAIIFLITTLHYRGKAFQITRLLNTDTIKQAVDKYNKMHDDIYQLRKDKREAERKLKLEQEHWQHEKEELEFERQELERSVEAAKLAHDHVQEKLEDHHEDAAVRRERMNRRDQAWANSVEVLQEYTQRESKRMALDRFGPGPHHVRFSVVLPSDKEEVPHYFTVECAPLDLMPHTVYLFLEQVVHGLWNNAWFYLNGPHVLQGGPQADDDHEEGEVALQRFKDLALDHLAFPEYSPEFPHVQFTLGFTGRPGGPDFYINKMNNTDSHGPGGQHQHHLEEFADPCFAKVIDGFETLEMIYGEYTYPDGHEWAWFYEYPIHIVDATLMEQAAPPVHPDTTVETARVGVRHSNTESLHHISKEGFTDRHAEKHAFEKPQHIPELEEMEHQVEP